MSHPTERPSNADTLDDQEIDIGSSQESTPEPESPPDQAGEVGSQRNNVRRLIGTTLVWGMIASATVTSSGIVYERVDREGYESTREWFVNHIPPTESAFEGLESLIGHEDSNRESTTAAIAGSLRIDAADIPEAVPAEPTAEEPTGTETSQESLLSQRVGFGRETSGGEGGETVHVTNANDSGPGSLREAVAGTEPKWVVFDDDYTIRLASGIPVGPNTTIDGRGQDVTLTGCQSEESITCANSTDGLVLRDTSNVIVTNLTVSGFGDIAQTANNDTYDGVAIENSDNVWIDHLNLTHTGDKALTVQEGATNVTISWNHFYDQEQVFQIGTQTGGEGDAVQNVTIHHNFFDQTGYRNPVISYGRAHVYNNYYHDWELYAVRSERTAQMYLENNVFEMGSSAKGAITKPAGDGCNDNGTRCDPRPGYLRAEGNQLIGSVSLPESSPETVFIPSESYSYTAETADDDLVNAIRAGTGPQ